MITRWLFAIGGFLLALMSSFFGEETVFIGNDFKAQYLTGRSGQ